MLCLQPDSLSILVWLKVSCSLHSVWLMTRGNWRASQERQESAAKKVLGWQYSFQAPTLIWHTYLYSCHSFILLCFTLPLASLDTTSSHEQPKFGRHCSWCCGQTPFCCTEHRLPSLHRTYSHDTYILQRERILCSCCFKIDINIILFQ